MSDVVIEGGGGWVDETEVVVITEGDEIGCKADAI